VAWADIRAHDEAKAARQHEAEAVWADHQAILDRIAAGDRAPAAPRVRSL
jgi:DNA-binding FadR family transcriptional regulator